jgi:hypothetical protein
MNAGHAGEQCSGPLPHGEGAKDLSGEITLTLLSAASSLMAVPRSSVPCSGASTTDISLTKRLVKGQANWPSVGPRTLGRGNYNPVAMGDRVRAYTVLLWAEGMFVRRASFQATRCYSTPPRLYLPKVHDMLHGLGGLHPTHNDAAKTERAPHSRDGRFRSPTPTRLS